MNTLKKTFLVLLFLATFGQTQITPAPATPTYTFGYSETKYKIFKRTLLGVAVLFGIVALGLDHDEKKKLAPIKQLAERDLVHEENSLIQDLRAFYADTSDIVAASLRDQIARLKNPQSSTAQGSTKNNNVQDITKIANFFEQIGQERLFKQLAQTESAQKIRARFDLSEKEMIGVLSLYDDSRDLNASKIALGVLAGVCASIFLPLQINELHQTQKI